MTSERAEYDTQPAYNESVLPTCPPSYSEAVASSPVREAPSTYQMPKPKPSHPHPIVSPASQVPVVCSNVILQPAQPPAMTMLVAVGPKSVRIRCPYCNSNILTETSTSVKRSAHYCCCMLFFCGCFLCSCIPYCLASFKNVNHTCPECRSFVGTYRP